MLASKTKDKTTKTTHLQICHFLCCYGYCTLNE